MPRMTRIRHRRRAARALTSDTAPAAVEPVGPRLTGVPYTDVRLLGRALRPHGRWRATGLAAPPVQRRRVRRVFAAASGYGVPRALAAAQAESLSLYPGFALIDA